MVMVKESIRLKEFRDNLKRNLGSELAAPDEAHPEMTEPLEEILVRSFIQLFNASVQVRLLPADWLTPTVIPVHTEGDRDNCGGYRPASLTSIFLRTPERVLRDTADNHMEASKPMAEKKIFGLTVLVQSN